PMPAPVEINQLADEIWTLAHEINISRIGRPREGRDRRLGGARVYRCAPGLYGGTRFASDDVREIRQCTDGRSLARSCRKPTSSLDFRTHRARRELRPGKRVRRGGPDGPLCRAAPIAVDRVRVGEHHKQVSVELAREKLRAEILVDDGLDTHEPAAGAGLIHRRYTAAARADYDGAVLEQPPDGPHLEYPLRH